MHKLTGRIWSIQRFNVHDGDGIRTMVFFKGCPLRCQWCANPEGQLRKNQLKFNKSLCRGCGICVQACFACSMQVDGISAVERSVCDDCGQCASLCPQRARELAGRDVTIDEVICEARKDEVFYHASGGGITLSGGEALDQRAFAFALLQQAKAEYIDTAVETCGAVPWDTFVQIMPVTDMFIYDIKLMDPKKHKQFTGQDNRRILYNARRLCESGASVLFRTPVIPGVNDDCGSIRAIGVFLHDIHAARWELLPFHQLGASKYEILGLPYALAGLSPIDEAVMAKLEREKSQCFGGPS